MLLPLFLWLRWMRLLSTLGKFRVAVEEALPVSKLNGFQFSSRPFKDFFLNYELVMEKIGLWMVSSDWEDSYSPSFWCCVDYFDCGVSVEISLM